ncbi:MAG: peptidylprolyl isomerase [Flavobacteriales bacterium]|nr:peptidylprolyl isomerase [Flavobacteriales bacterium]
MAVIGKIRERSGLLVGIIGGALLLFILGELLSGRGKGRQDQVLGEAGGEEISVAEYERRVSDEVESYRNDFNQPASPQLTEQVRNTVWNEMVKSRVMMDQVTEAGFTITKPEYDDIRFGDNILPEFKGQFQGPDGQVDREKLRGYFDRVQLNAPVYHEIQSRRIQENRLYAKYSILVKKSLFVNSAQARDEFNGKNTRATFNFVAKRYDAEPDSLYAVSDQDLRRYYDQHKNDPKYKQKASRTFEYVLFPVVATGPDREAIMKEVGGLKEPFETAADDSTFVVANAASRAYSKVPYTEGTADAMNDSLIIHASVGTVIGPFVEGEQVKLVKVKELADIPEARVRHILLSTQKGRDEAQVKPRADSLLAVVKKDRTKFADMVTKFSDDPGSVSNGGVYEWFDKKQMVPEFTAASFDQKVGAITICKTDFGFHIVEVLGQRNRSERRVITVDRPVKPSPATFKEVYKRANDFSLRYKNHDAMKAAADSLGLQMTEVKDFSVDSKFVQGLQQPASVISWVNRAEVGKVSDPKDAGENYVVSVLNAVKAEGAPDIEDVREPFTKEVVKQKKAEAFTAKMQGKTDLNALATEMNVSVQTATDMLYNAFNIPGGTSEYEVVGQIFALQNGQTSVPLKGDQAMYVVSMTTKTDAPADGDISGDRSSLLSRVQSRAENGVFNALKEASGVVDHRYMFY